MNLDWRGNPATEEQKEILRFFGCTWDEGITAGQASDALVECAKLFPRQVSKASVIKGKCQFSLFKLFEIRAGWAHIPFMQFELRS